MTFMRARTLAFTVAACSPVLLLALIGISGRFLVLPWQTPEYGPEAERDLLAYTVPVSEVAKLSHDHHLRTLDNISRVADLWIEGGRSGTLKIVPPASGMDYGGDGVRQEIENAKRNLLTFIIHSAEDSINAKKYDEAATILAKSVELAEVVKYNSPLNTSSSAAAQASCLDMLARLQPKISPETAHQVAAAVFSVEPQPSLTDRGYERMVVMNRLSVHADTDSSLDFAPWKTVVNADAVDLLKFNSNNGTTPVILMNTYRQAYDRDLRCVQALNVACEKYQGFYSIPTTIMVAYH